MRHKFLIRIMIHECSKQRMLCQGMTQSMTHLKRFTKFQLPVFSVKIIVSQQLELKLHSAVYTRVVMTFNCIRQHPRPIHKHQHRNGSSVALSVKSDCEIETERQIPVPFDRCY